MTGNGMTVCGWIADEDNGWGTSPTGPAARDAVARVERQLGRVRTMLRRLDPVTLGIAGRRYEALLLSYDMYVRMMVDALTDAIDAMEGGTPDDALTDDWRIAQEGLFGPDGVVPVILAISARPTAVERARQSTPDSGWWTVMSDAA